MAALKPFVLSVLVGQALANPLAKSDVCNAGYATVNGKQFTISCGVDRPGNDYDRLETSLDGCIAACGADNKCTTAQYLNTNGFCYLKDRANELIQKESVYTIDVGPACKQSSTVTIQNLQCTISCGTDNPGGDYSQARLGNYLACAQACAADDRCSAANYNEGNGYCYFKSVKNDAISKFDTDSIVCRRSTQQISSTTTQQMTTTSSASSTTTTPAEIPPTSPNGATCFYNSDCQSGRCTSTNRCGPLPNGVDCGQDKECESNYCQKPYRGASTGQCGVRKSTGQTCVYNEDCASNYCTLTNYCGPTSNGYFCGRNSDCQSNFCDPSNGVSGYGTCRASSV